MVIKLEFFILLGCHSTLRFLRGARRVRKNHDQPGQVINVERISLCLPYNKLLVDIVGFSFEVSVSHDFFFKLLIYFVGLTALFWCFIKLPPLFFSVNLLDLTKWFSGKSIKILFIYFIAKFIVLIYCNL
jgi:hypothetical protein